MLDSMHFADRLFERVKKTSPVCVGLDPRMEKIPENLPRTPEGVFLFNTAIIDAVKNVVSCVKPQLAYYELLGTKGMQIFWETCAYAHKHGLLVIADGKRGDIGETCEAYADAYLGIDSPVDALTVNPYLGGDTVIPFLKRCMEHEKGIFVLVKTSNASSGDLQDLPCGDEVLSERVAHLVTGWGKDALGESGLSCVGAVVGAPYPEEMKYLRSIMPLSPFLIPGYGAQGGTPADVAHGFIAGTGAIVNSSRGIIYASSGKDFAEAAWKAAEKMAAEISAALANDNSEL